MKQCIYHLKAAAVALGEIIKKKTSSAECFCLPTSALFDVCGVKIRGDFITVEIRDSSDCSEGAAASRATTLPLQTASGSSFHQQTHEKVKFRAI